MDAGTLATLGWLSKAVTVAAELGFADILGDEALTAAKIAGLSGANPDAAQFLMQWLASVGVFQCDSEGNFSNNALSDPLRSNHPQSIRHLCMLMGGMYYDAWGGLTHTVLTGKPAFSHVFGDSVFPYKETHPEQAMTYDRAMEDMARPVGAALLECFDLSAIRVVVDVGGGSGTMLRRLLAPHEQLRGICADRADVCRRAAAEPESLADREIAGRLSFEPIDFFTTVPANGDLYILKNVLYDWNDDSRLRILESIRQAMRQTAALDDRPGSAQPRLLVIEPLIDPARSLFQMVICEEGTRGLDESGMRSLLQRAKYDIASVKYLPTQHTVYECVVADHR